MSYLKRELVVDVPFYAALCGEFVPRAADGDVQMLGRMAYAAYAVGVPHVELTASQYDYRPARIGYAGKLSWAPDVRVWYSGYQRANPETQRTEFSPDSVRLESGDRQLAVAKEHPAFGHDGREPQHSHLTLTGLPDSWDQSMGLLPLDTENLSLVRRVVADVALQFFNGFA